MGSTTTGGGEGGGGEEEAGVLRVLNFEDEDTATQTLFRLDNIPTKLPSYS
jgi:hypothetical protein